MHSLSADSTLPLQKAPMKWQVLPTVVEGLKRSSRQQAMAIAAMLHKMQSTDIITPPSFLPLPRFGSHAHRLRRAGVQRQCSSSEHGSLSRMS
ncbi:hypothetical protein FQA47_008712 [Oryzias melastigma]|uniref:Uncharacterized protein n=1 Tax=Oryzias melastigma TaxID=30732 RepID=A0A834F9E5_ORYME|nr:hypothetical protein FQA47_008712 [Oryzias melastigma]